MLLSLILFCSSPESEILAAYADAAKHPESTYQQYLSTYNLSATDASDCVNAMRFWVNSLSNRKTIRRPFPVSNTLWRVDIRDYGWEAKALDNLGKEDVFFQCKYALPSESDKTYVAKYGLYQLTGRLYPILRADFFIAKTSLEPHYSAFLKLPPKLADVQAIYADEKAVKKLGLQQGGAVLESIVALHNRGLERWPTLTGAWWLSREVADDTGGGNVLDAKNIFGIHEDAGEFIWNLPNGLQAYYLANADGQQQVEVPPNIAVDAKTKFQDKRVLNARSCVTCHELGINSFENVIAQAIADGSTYASKDYQTTLAIEEFHLSPLGEAIRADQERYARAVHACNGLEPQGNANCFESVCYRYLEGRVTIEIAATELGCTVEELRKCIPYTGDATVNYLLTGKSISRTKFESVYHLLAASLHKRHK